MKAVSVQAPADGFRFTSVAKTHAGARRSVNEDRILDRPQDGFWAVADGMGGHLAGDVAADRLVAALAAVEHGASGYACLADIVRQVEKVNEDLFRGDGGAAPATSGSTLVALLAHEGHYACLWAGDSRAYLWRGGRLTAITRDHSIIQELVDRGVVAEADRRGHPSANLVTRAVGADLKVQLDRRFAPLVEGDVFLLCSDGLTGCLDEGEIASTLQAADLDRAAELLIEAALQRRAPDNVSLILVSARQAG